ncbi:MAG: hypothetical protein GXO09_01105, partial [Crenarchaeota archaeon]|nr:hypothetical protein [Thermoproteota archaeon]
IFDLEAYLSSLGVDVANVTKIVTDKGAIITIKEALLEEQALLTARQLQSLINQAQSVQPAAGTTTSYAAVAGAVKVVLFTPLSQVTTLPQLLSTGAVSIQSQLLTPPTASNIQSGAAAGVQSADNYVLEQIYVFKNVHVMLWNNPNLVARGAPCSVPYIPVSTFLMGYKPGNLSAFNMMIYMINYWSDYVDNCNYGPELVIWNSTNYYAFPISTWTNSFRRIHIKILGFMPSSKDQNFNDGFYFAYYEDYPGTAKVETTNPVNARGYWWFYGQTFYISNSYGADAAAFLYLNGTADVVEVYVDTVAPTPNAQTSYLPYMFIADYDGNGLAEIVFSDEDFIYGPYINNAQCTYDDYLSSWWYSSDYRDWTTIPMLINFTGSQYIINGTTYAGVILTVRVYFHDSEGGDINCVLNPLNWLLAFFLVNNQTKAIESSYEIIYQTMSTWEDTWPPNTNFQIITVPLILPTNATTNYFLSIGFQDPYGLGSNGCDDLEYTIAVEVAGLTYLAR